MGKDNNKITNATGNAASGKDYTSAETASTKRGRGRPRKDGSEPGGSKTEADVPRLVLVNDPNREGNEVEETEEQAAPAAPAAPKNPKRKRKDIQYEIKKEQLAVLIKSTFDIIGSREGLEMWKLSQKEADLIAEPLSGLMAKNPIIDKLTSEYGEWIALILALGTVIVPRAFVMWAAKPDKKEPVKNYVTTKQIDGKQGAGNQGKSTGDKSGAPGSRDQQSNRQPASTSRYLGTELHGIIPAIQ